MAWFKYLALIGIIGVANADLICYTKTLSACLQTNKLLADLCIDRASYNASTCVQESAKTCKVDKDKDIVDLVAKTADICKPGTKANNDYKKHWPCIAGTFNPPVCAQDLNKYLQDLAMKGLPQDKLMKEAFKASCKFTASVNNCTVAKAAKVCGADAGNFTLDQQTGPAERINKRFCVLINGVGRNSLNLSVWAVQALILFFTFKFSSY